MRKLKKRVVICSHAAGGKDFLRDVFVDRGYTPDVSITSRPARDGEEDGRTYHYTSDFIFDELKGLDAFYECVSFNNWQYGTLKSSWDKSDIFIMTPSGISQISEKEREECFVIYLDIPEPIRRTRLSLRSDSDSMERRIEADRTDFKGFNDFDMYVCNPLFDPEGTIEFVENILLDEN